MTRLVLIGLIGFSIALVLNLFGLVVLNQPAAHLFGVGWWSTWFPSYAVWLVLTIVGVGAQFVRQP